MSVVVVVFGSCGQGQGKGLEKEEEEQESVTTTLLGRCRDGGGYLSHWMVVMALVLHSSVGGSVFESQRNGNSSSSSREKRRSNGRLGWR